MKSKIYVLLFVAAILVSFSRIYGQSKVTVNSDQTISINGSKFFPISVYVQSDYAGIKNMGVNVASRPFCVNIDAFNQIVAQQLYCHYTAGSGCGDDNATDIKNRSSSGFTSSINQVKGSNYLFGYGLPDEAKTSEGLSATDTEWAYGVIKAADPNHPVFFTEYSSDISAYKNSADIFLNDEYPFNNDANPLYDIKTKIKNMQTQVAPKPVWPIIQTGSQFGMPTNAQIRAETYLSIALGSTGLIFYSYDVEDAGGIHNIKTDGDPAFMKNLITELKSSSPYFLGTKNTNLTYTSNDIDAILRDYNGKSYLIAVNKNASAKSITFSLNGFSNATAKIVGLSAAGSSRTGQTITISSGSLSDTFQGLEAVVYEISTSCSVPGQPGSITGNTNVITGSSNTYSISAVSGATTYTWTLPSGWSGNSTTTSITATAGSAGGTITVKANNACGAGSASSLAVTVGTTSSNLALNKTTSTSSVEAVGYEGDKAVDGNSTTTRWSSAYTDAEWIYVDLGATYNVNRVKITWEAAYGKDYKIQIAASTAGPWSDLKSITGNSALVNDHTGLTGSGRYVKVLGSLRGTAWGYSVYELEVYGTSGCTLPAQPGTISGNTTVTSGSSNTYSIASVSGATSYTWTLPSGWSGSSTTTSITSTAGSAGGTISVKANNACGASAVRTLAVTVGSSTTNLALNKPTTTSSIEGTGLEGSKAVDGNATTTRWASVEGVDPQWIRIDLGASFNVNRVKIVWEAAYASAYQVQVSADGSTWTNIKSVTGNTTLSNDWTGLTGTGRYVRINGTTRGTTYGYSIYELEVYGNSAGRLISAEESTSSVEDQISIYPNPVEDQLFIAGFAKVKSVRIYNLQGQTIMSVENPGNSISVQSLAAGLHIAVVEKRHGKIEKIRFTKK
jgi:hypothetical protein